MLLAAFSVLLVGTYAAAVEFSAYKPDAPVIIAEYSHSAQISIDPANVPEGTVSVYLQAMEIADLTGNIEGVGYVFGYNAAVPTFYYPQLDEGKFFEYRVRFGNGESYSDFSDQSGYSHADASRIELEEIARSWVEAKEFCVLNGKHLASINSQKLNDKIEALLSEQGGENAWIGLYDDHYNDDSASTTWKWIDGSKFKFDNFEKGASVEASTLDSSAVAINNMGEWETHSPDEKKVFFCIGTKAESISKAEESARGIVVEA